ncbi:MAG: DUF308 domain-containing protein [Acidimicrobiia bacterium]|nr:DUF308 domain-containing protein [Acidimicrobiia bacterium]
MFTQEEARMAKTATGLWWVWLVVGIIWILIALIVLQFDTTSAVTIGVLTGVIFIVAGLQYFFVASQVEGWKWLYFLIGLILVIGGFVALVYPGRTFLIMANILGFLFAITGIFWIVEAFVRRSFDDLWWLGLISGIIMVLLGFWLGGQLIGVQATTLVVFVGLWALFRGILDIVTAFQVRSLGKDIDDLTESAAA